MSPPCHQEVPRRRNARVIDMERARVERLADEIASQLRNGGGSVCRLAEDVVNVARWRRAARRAGRLLGVSVRTRVSYDGVKVWASEGP